MTLRAEVGGLSYSRLLGAFAWALLVALARPAAAGDVRAHGAPSMRVFGEEDGIPQGSIYAMAFEPGGGLWIGTQAGPAYYDGQRFSPLPLPVTGASRWVRSIAVTGDGAVWFGMQNGDIVRHARDGLTRFTGAEGLPNARVLSLAEVGARGATTLWAGTDKGLYRLEGARWARFDLGLGAERQRIHALHPGALPSGEATLWIGTDEGLVHLEDQGSAASVTSAEGLPGAPVHALLETAGEDGQRVLWAGTSKGLARYANGRWESLGASDARAPANAVLALAETVSGLGKRALWAGTKGGGLARLEDGTWTTLSSDSSDLPHNYVLALASSSGVHGGRTLWIGTQSGGLARLRHDGWFAFTQRNGALPGAAVFVVEQVRPQGGVPEIWLSADDSLARFSGQGFRALDRQRSVRAGSLLTSLVASSREPDVLWIGSNGDGLERWEGAKRTSFTTRNSPLPHDTIFRVSESLDGRALWISTRGGAARIEGDAWQVYQAGPSPLVDDDVTTIFETARPGGKVTTWFGTAKGLSRLEDGQWRSYSPANAPLRSHYIQSLAELRDGRGARVLWVGTMGGGASRYDLDAERWLETISAESRPALPGDTVYQARADAWGRVYLFTNRGISRLTPRVSTPSEPEEFSIYTFTTEDGLPSNECNLGAALVDADGNIWAGTTAGAAVFDPDEEVQDLVAKPLVFTSARAAGSEEPLSFGEALGWDRNTVSFDYTLLAFFREHDTRYRTQLVGFDAAPSEWSADPKARYTNLTAGRYTFQLWGRDYAGNVAGPLAMPFSVKPAPWRTVWAYLGYAVALLGLVYGGVRARLRALAIQNRALEARVEERARELRQKNAELDRKNDELDRKNRELDGKIVELEASQRRADRIFSTLAEVLPGTQLDGKYLIERKIGSGGFGTVFRATHTGLARAVAVKIFRPSPGNDSALALERFLLEGASACRVAHPNAVQVFDSGISPEGIAYLVMEMLEGHSLAEELSRGGPLALRRAARILAQMCAVLEAAHATGLLHRDIKPENVFLHRAAEGEAVKVVDFGIAKLLGPDSDQPDLTGTGGFVGTPLYMAPERFDGEPYDARSDVYSVGVTVYEMVSGALPHPAGDGSLLQLVMHKLTRAPRDLRSLAPWVPAEAARIVMHCLAQDPAARPSLAELRRVFGEAVSALPDEAQDEIHARRVEADPLANTLPDEG